MLARPTILINTAEVELWPAQLLRARSNRDARVLARARWLLRRKRDGRFLAADLPEGLLPLVPRLNREPGLAAALDALELATLPSRAAGVVGGELPLHGLSERLAQLGLDHGYGERCGLALVAEPRQLHLASRDRYRRPLWLLEAAARAWQRLLSAAQRDGIQLEAISGYRSHAYQMGIFERKRARGLSVEDILAVNAAPGYSEHHSGRALDLGTEGEPPAEASFETTPAFAWLREHAADFDFQMSYPRDNPHGIVYEPWHWCWRAPHKDVPVPRAQDAQERP